MKNKKILFILQILFILLILPIGKSASVVKCVDDNTLQTNTSYGIFWEGVNLGTLEIAVPKICDYGCDNVTSTCSPSQLNLTVWVIIIIFAFLLVIGLVKKIWR